MYEEYTTTDKENSLEIFCPFSLPIISDGHDPFCFGERCMAFVFELDDNGSPTGRGRCGMVQPIREMSARDRERLAGRSHV